MNLAEMALPELAGTLLGFVLTLFVFSYIFGDNALFRVAIHLFIGVASGLAAVIAWYNVIWPQLMLPLVRGSQSERMFVLVPLLLAGILFLKASPRLSWIGTPVLGYLVGVGVATAIGGAVLGTMFPQILASINLFDLETVGQERGEPFVSLLNSGIFLIGTISTLAYFQFGVRQRPNQPAERGPIVELLASVGKFFIVVAFGALYAGVFIAALTALVERVQFLVDFMLPLIFPQ